MLQVILYGLFFGVLSFLSYSDFKENAVPRPLTIALLVISAIMVWRLPLPLIPALISAGIGFFYFFLPYLFTRGKSIGIGDTFVFSACAIILKPHETIFAGLLTCVLALFFALLKKKKAVPLVPFMEGALIIIIMTGGGH